MGDDPQWVQELIHGRVYWWSGWFLNPKPVDAEWHDLLVGKYVTEHDGQIVQVTATAQHTDSYQLRAQRQENALNSILEAVAGHGPKEWRCRLPKGHPGPCEDA